MQLVGLASQAPSVPLAVKVRHGISAMPNASWLIISPHAAMYDTSLWFQPTLSM